MIAATDPYAVIDRDPPEPQPDTPPRPDGSAEGFCPRCGDRLGLYTYDLYDPRLGRHVVVADQWDACEACAQDDALDRMRARTPWLFAQPGAVDEHDVMGQDWQAGIDVYELVR